MISGDIASYDLEDWWLNELTDKERELIRDTYKPISIGKEVVIDKGHVRDCKNNKAQFVGDLIGWFKKKEYYNLVLKILKSVTEEDVLKLNILDKHFYYMNISKFYYRFRDIENNIDTAIYYMDKQIDLSSKAKKAFLKEYPDCPLPSHSSYTQAAIILEKNNMYDNAIKTCLYAQNEGWSGDWDKRIERLNKKLDKIKTGF